MSTLSRFIDIYHDGAKRTTGLKETELPVDEGVWCYQSYNDGGGWNYQSYDEGTWSYHN